MSNKAPRSPNPVSSFGPELLNALIEGSKRRLEVKDVTYREAVKFRQRCHQLRHRMRIEGHQLAEIVAKTRLSIVWDKAIVETLYTSKKRVGYPKDPEAKVTLVIEPHDSEFRDALAAAGITIRPITDDGIVPSEASGSDTPAPSIEKLLGDL